MRRTSKAPSPSAHRAGSTAAGHRARGLFGLACLCVLGLTAFLGSSAPSVGAAQKFPGQGFLPNDRAWELVSPQEKNGGGVGGRTTRTRAAANGNAVQFSALTAFAGVQGTGLAADYVARRTAEPGTQGWETHGIIPVQEPLAFIETISLVDAYYLGEFSPDLSKAVFLAHSPLGAPAPNVANVNNLYLRNDILEPGAGSYQLITDCLVCSAPLALSPARQPGFADASDDFGHVIFESRVNLTADAPAQPAACVTNPNNNQCRVRLYEWDHGTLRYVGILPDGTAAQASAAGRGAGANNTNKGYTPNTISDDGSRIVFTTDVDANSNGTPTSGVYLREDHELTVKLNASERTDCAGDPTCGGDGTPDPAPDPGGERQATYWAGSEDLSRLFFASEEQLTNTEGSGLYMYDATRPDTDPDNLTLVSVDTEPDGPPGAGISGVIGASEDGDYVYFVTSSSIIDDGISGSTAASCDPEAPCIVAWHDGVLRHVAQVNGDSQEAARLYGNNGWRSSDVPKTARVTPDGEQLVFVSEGNPALNAAAGVPGYDHVPTGHPTNCGGIDATSLNQLGKFAGETLECTEVYLYDSTADGGEGEVTCVSCNPSGTHSTPMDATFDFDNDLGGASRGSHLNHPLSDDGRYVFFSTGEALVPEDDNGATMDVYQYDTATDEVSLLSTGKSEANSYFQDASADGREVFFRTEERLTGWDLDEQYDLYTARIGGGLPDPSPPPPSCEGDACQPAPVVLNDPTPSSAGLAGPGDPSTRKAKARGCPKGKRRVKARNGKKARCVKRKRSAGKNRANRDRRASR